MKIMRPALISALLALFSICAVAGEPAPEVKQGPNEVEIRNAHFRVFFAKDNGGALSAIFGKGDTPLVGETYVYTDSGVYDSRFFVGSRYEPNSKMTCTKRDGAVEYEAEGLLRVKPGDAHTVEPMRYRVKYTIDASDLIRVSWGVMPDFSKDLESGFLACVVNLPGFAEWFANTQDGLVCEQAANEAKRTFQSSAEPLSLSAPRVGAITAKGQVLVFEGFRATVPIQNIFFHEGKGAASFFVAILDGPTNLKLEKGTWWQVDFTIRILDSVAQMAGR